MSSGRGCCGVSMLSKNLKPAVLKLNQCKCRSDYLRKAAILTKFLNSNPKNEDLDDARFLVAVEQRPLVDFDKESADISLRLLSYQECLDKFESIRCKFEPREPIFLDLIENSSDQFEAIYGYCLRSKDVKADVPETDRKYLNMIFGGEFISGRLIMLLCKSDNDRNLITKFLSLAKWTQTFKHCPTCTRPLKLSTKRKVATCESCAKSFYPSLTPVAICLLHNRENTKALLVRHPRNPKYVYTAIAGFAEVGESLEQTVHREIAEEVGISCEEVTQLNITQSWPFPDGSLMCAFTAIADTGHEISICNEELIDARWFTREEILHAYENIIKDPTMNNAEHIKSNTNFRYIPPFGAIAHRIIEHWLENH